jgi:ankyrin repeat protein
VFRICVAAILAAGLLAGNLAAASEGRVDFRRDVMPLIQQNCIGCHGPTKQMNSFRLDRRSIALRGGSVKVITPGNSPASRLYLRLIGTQFGLQMPPTGALSPEAIDVFRRWIDQGAEWPDDVAGEADLPAPDALAVRMVDVLRNGDLAAFETLAGENPKALNLRGPGGATPFMFAALYGDAALLERLRARGGDPNAVNDANATALMWAVGDLAKVRVLVEHGAQVNARPNDGRTPLFIAATQPGSTAVVKYLLDHGAEPNPGGRAPGDSTPLRQAAVAGDAEVMRVLIDHGANIKAMGAAGLSATIEADCEACFKLVGTSFDQKIWTAALLDMAIVASPRDLKFAIDRGAGVNAADERGRTPLMFAANSDLMRLDAVKLLLDRGADINAKNLAGQTALDMARLRANTPIVDLLIKSGAKGDTPAPAALQFVGENNTIQSAVERSLPIIQKADVNFMEKAGCFSCHNEGLTAMAVGTARRKGFTVDERLSQIEVKHVAEFFNGWRDRLLQGIAPGGVAYALVGLHDQEYKADLNTDAIARYVKQHQLPDGHFQGVGCGGSRPPLCGTEITNTALALRALQFYAPNTDKVSAARSIQAAGLWLAKAQSNTNEDRAYRLLGLVWADRDRDAVRKALRELSETQRQDGGWPGIASMSSDAYATGEALVALSEAGVPPADRVFQRGVTYLLSTQLTDGSWYMKTRALPVQPYFDNGFPHGEDQWISVAATDWATMALALAAPSQNASRAGH